MPLERRKVTLCEKCWRDHIDFSKLAAALEHAKGRKCADASCTVHGEKICGFPRRKAEQHSEPDGKSEESQKTIARSKALREALPKLPPRPPSSILGGGEKYRLIDDIAQRVLAGVDHTEVE
jgi:hypothetical protein